MNVGFWVGIGIVILGAIIYALNINRNKSEAMPGATVAVLVGGPIGGVGLIIVIISLLVHFL